MINRGNCRQNLFEGGGRAESFDSYQESNHDLLDWFLMNMIRKIVTVFALTIVVCNCDAQGYTPSYSHVIAVRFTGQKGPPAVPTDVRLPSYPQTMLRVSGSGSVIAIFWVRSDGTVKSTTIVKSTNIEFSEATAAAIRNWHFNVASKSGLDQVTEVNCKIDFNIIEE